MPVNTGLEAWKLGLCYLMEVRQTATGKANPLSEQQTKTSQRLITKGYPKTHTVRDAFSLSPIKSTQRLTLGQHGKTYDFQLHARYSL